MDSYEDDTAYDDESRGLLGSTNDSSRPLHNPSPPSSTPVGQVAPKPTRHRAYRGQNKDNGKFVCLVFGGIMIALSFLLITIYVLKFMGNEEQIPVYRHISEYGPKYRAGKTESEVHKSFAPSIWLPAVTRDNILETLLSTAKQDVWVNTLQLKQHLDSNSAFSRDDIDGLYSPYPSSESYPFTSLQVHPNAFPVTYPSAKGPVTAYIHEHYVPVKTYYLIEFYAEWCGHCQRFSSHAERLAYTFNSDTHSPVRMLKVHCAGKGKDICTALNIRGYPTLLMANTHTWIYVLSHLMPEYFERVSLFYLRYRGSSPPPGQGAIDVSQNLRTLTEYSSLLERVPSSVTADGVLEWVNNYLGEQRKSQHKLIENHTVFNGALAYSEYLRKTSQDDKQDDSSKEMATKMVQQYGYPLDDMTSFTIMPQTILTSGLLRDYKLTIDYDPLVNKGVQPSIVMLTMAGLSYNLPYRFDLLTDDEIQKRIIADVALFAGDLPSSSSSSPGDATIGDNTNDDTTVTLKRRQQTVETFTKENNGQRGRKQDSITVTDDELDNQLNADQQQQKQQDEKVNPTTTIPNKRHLDVPTESPRIPSIPLEAIGGQETLMSKFKQGYPKYANEHDQLLYWSIALREVIPMCARQMEQYHADRQKQTSTTNNSSGASTERLVQMMKSQIDQFIQRSAKGNGGIPLNDSDIPHQLTYLSIDELDAVMKKQSSVPRHEFNSYLSNETCYESIVDMLTLLCEYSTFSIHANQQCQTSFCLLRNTLSDFIPPPLPQDLYHLNSLSDRLTLVHAAGNAPSTARKDIHSEWEMCGKPWSFFDEQDWVQCKGSQEDTRGYTCGLWSNIHALAVALNTKASKYQQHRRLAHDYNVQRNIPQYDIPEASKFVLTLRSYLYNFFLCEECQNHFLRYSNHLPWDIAIPITTTNDELPQNGIDDDVAFDPNASTHTRDLLSKLSRPRTNVILATNNDHATTSPSTVKVKPMNSDGERENHPTTSTAVVYTPEEHLILWLWDTHNKVNKRLATLEEQYDVVDPIFPKVYFPLYGMCPHCRIADETLCVEANRSKAHQSSPRATDTTSISQNKKPVQNNSDGSKQQQRNILSDSECLWDDAWDYQEVLKYLVNFYSPAH